MVEKKLSDKTVVEAYPITQAQRMMYYLFNSYGANVPVLNIGTGYYWQGDIDVEIMKKALEEAIERCDTMRLRFTPDRQYGLLQYIVDESGIEIEEVDLSNMTHEEAHLELKKWTYEMIEMFEKPLHTVRIMHFSDNYHGLYIKFHHLAMDGYSVKVFLADVMAIYYSIKDGTPYPKPMKPYKDAVEKELAYMSSQEREDDRKYWIDTFQNSSEPIFNDYLLENRLYKQREECGDPNRRFAILHEGNHPAAQSLYYEIDAETTDKIMDACKKNGLSVACVLMTGLRTALSVFNDNEKDISFKFMINRRGSLLEKKSGGIRLHFYTIRSIVEPEDTFAKAVEIVEKEQNEIFKHCSFDTLEMYQIKHQIMKMGSLDQTYDCMSFSYHPYMDIPCDDEETKKTTKGIWYNNDVSMQPLYLTVKHRTNDKGFEFIFEYRVDSDPRADLEILFDKMQTALKMGTENPNITIGEILEKLHIER